MDVDTIQSLLYGKLEVQVKNPSLTDQLQCLRALVSNPAAAPRLRISGEVHPWIVYLLENSGLKCLPPSESPVALRD